MDVRHAVRLLAGEICVRGWLGEDKIISGNVFITSNYKDYKEFDFRGRAKWPRRWSRCDRQRTSGQGDLSIEVRASADSQAGW